MRYINFVIIFLVVLLMVNYADAQSTSFTLVNSYFGVNNHTINPVPGQKSVPLTLVLENNQDEKLVNNSLQLYNFNSGFKPVNGEGSVTEEIPMISPDQIFSVTYYVNIPTYAKENQYYLDLEIKPNGLTTDAETILIPFTYGGVPDINFSYSPSNLVEGEINNVTLVINNTGSGSVYNLQPYITSQSSGIKVLNRIPKISVLNVNSSINETLKVYVPSQASSQVSNISSPFSSVTFTAQSSYLNYYGQLENQTSQFTIPVHSVENLIVKDVNTNAKVGAFTPIKFNISNIGEENLSSLAISLSADVGGVAVTKNSTVYVNELKPNESIMYIPTLSIGSSVAKGGYTGDITISYTTPSGQLETASYPIGFSASSLINLSLESVSISNLKMPSNAVEATASGSIIDEGSGNAYYTTLYGYIESDGKIIAENSTYVGEVESDSPMPFSLIINTNKPINAKNSSLVIYEGYKDSFNQNLKSNKTVLSMPEPTAYSQVSNSTFYKKRYEQNNSTILYVVIVVIVIIAIVGIYEKRRHKKVNKDKPVV